jgi:hypothetical protein
MLSLERVALDPKSSLVKPTAVFSMISDSTLYSDSQVNSLRVLTYVSLRLLSYISLLNSELCRNELQFNLVSHVLL